MKAIRISLLIIIAGVLLSGCKGKKAGIEVVPNLELIYLPISQVDVPLKAEPGFEAKAEKDLVNAVESVRDNKLKYPLVYMIKVRLFIDENGEIEKLKDMGTSAGYLDSGRNLHSVSTAGLDEALASNISSWKFKPAIKNGKPVKTWTDLNVDIPMKADGSYLSFSLPDFLSNYPGINDFVPVDAMPTIIHSEVPHYPELAKRAGIEGTAYVKVLVDKAGIPKKAVVFKSDNEIFNQPSIDAAMNFRFSAAYKGYMSVPVWVVVPFRYKLDGSKGELMKYKDLKKMPAKK